MFLAPSPMFERDTGFVHSLPHLLWQEDETIGSSNDFAICICLLKLWCWCVQLLYEIPRSALPQENSAIATELALSKNVGTVTNHLNLFFFDQHSPSCTLVPCNCFARALRSPSSRGSSSALTGCGRFVMLCFAAFFRHRLIIITHWGDVFGLIYYSIPVIFDNFFDP